MSGEASKAGLLQRLLDTTITTLDDRGRRARLAPRANEEESGSGSEKGLPLELEQATLSQRGSSPTGKAGTFTVFVRVGSIPWLLFVVPAILLVLGILILAVLLLARALYVRPAILAIGVAGSLYVLWWVYRLTLRKWRLRQRAGRVVAQWLKTGRCASCGYSLQVIAVEQDGCKVCPECGAAWNLARWAARARESMSVRNRDLL